MAEFQNVNFSYGDKKILHDFSFGINEGESTAVLGPSGFGKTTLMELLAGFLKPESGKIIPFEKSPVFVFQEDRLLPFRNALDNLLAVNIDKKSALSYLEKVGLSGSADKFPDELSGGMCRRLSIARALAFGGDVFFFDEPLRGLDIRTSGEILELIRNEIKGKTALIITHSPKEAFSLCDRFVVAGGEPLSVIADRRKSDFSDENELSDFLEKMI